MLNKEVAQDLVKTLKIDIFTVYREYLQLLFLKYFYNQKGSEKVYFKGGTALRFLYGSFRFSEDLDFTAELLEKQIKVLINKTLKDLNKEMTRVILKKIETNRISFSSRIVTEIPEFKFPLSVRLDFSLRERPILPTSSYVETIFPVSPYPQVCYLRIDEILSEKIRAILTRNRGRDIFDLWFILSKKVSIDWDLVNKKMVWYKKGVDLEKLICAMENFPEEEIKTDLTRFLPITHRGLVGKLKGLTLEKLKQI